MTVLFIALLHAVPVFMIAIWTKSKTALIVVAILAAFIGIKTGNSAYVLADLIGVVIAFILGFALINDQKTPSKSRIEKPAPMPIKKDEDSSLLSGVLALGIASAFFYNKITENAKPSLPTPQVQHQTFAPPKAEESPRSQVRKHDVTRTKRASSDLRYCLNLPTDAAIMRCANQGQ